jgi:hypothetical protein
LQSTITLGLNRPKKKTSMSAARRIEINRKAIAKYRSDPVKADAERQRDRERKIKFRRLERQKAIDHSVAQSQKWVAGGMVLEDINTGLSINREAAAEIQMAFPLLLLGEKSFGSHTCPILQ